jgi:hypothetical protein
LRGAFTAAVNRHPSIIDRQPLSQPRKYSGLRLAGYRLPVFHLRRGYGGQVGFQFRLSVLSALNIYGATGALGWDAL